MALSRSSKSEVSRRDLVRLSLAGTIPFLLSPFAATPAAASEPQPGTPQIPYEPTKIDPKLKAVLEKIPHTVLLYDLGEVERCFQNFRDADADVDIHYAVKCAPNPRVISRLVRAGSGFDVASPAEVDLVLDAGGDPSKCIYSNTCKYPQDVRYAYSKGITAFLADSEYEVRMQAKEAPGTKLYVRLLVDNKEAAHPLGEKFGTTPEKARELLRLGKQLGLEPYGTHFHVGTQCYSAKAWEEPSREAAAIFRDLKKEGITLQLFDVGGGFPVQYLGRKVPTNAEIINVVRSVIKEELGENYPLTLAVEPGRGLVGSAALMSSRVMLRAARPGAEWLHIDVGVYHGLSDAPDGIRYSISSDRTGAPIPYTICGPTCDSADTISKNQLLPGDLEPGDLLILNKTGAYAECLFSHFNGIKPPEVKYLDDIVG